MTYNIDFELVNYLIKIYNFYDYLYARTPFLRPAGFYLKVHLGPYFKLSRHYCSVSTTVVILLFPPLSPLPPSPKSSDYSLN